MHHFWKQKGLKWVLQTKKKVKLEQEIAFITDLVLEYDIVF